MKRLQQTTFRAYSPKTLFESSTTVRAKTPEEQRRGHPLSILSSLIIAINNIFSLLNASTLDIDTYWVSRVGLARRGHAQVERK
jgi:hypothetical protein